MTLGLRSKLALAFAFVATVPLIGIQQVTASLMRREFEQRTRAESESLRTQIERQVGREGRRLAARVEEASRSYPLSDALLAYVASPRGASHRDLIRVTGEVAATAGLPLLTLYGDDGTVLASAQEPARFDVLEPRAIVLGRAYSGRPVLAREEGIAVSGLSLRTTVQLDAARLQFWLAGGRLLDDDFLGALAVPEAKALLLVGADGVRAVPTVGGREALALVREVVPEALSGVVESRLTAGGFGVTEVILPGVANAAGVRILLATSRRPLEAALRKLQASFATLLGAGLLVAAVLAWVVSRRWTEPIAELVRGLDQVAHGDLSPRIQVRRDDELGRLVGAFHDMTRDLAESRQKLLQSERIAAWREIARRLAHEIKNPLSPIALSMETLRRSHAAGHKDFPQHLAECTETVLEEVERLRRIVQEFSDFARLPPPRLVEDSFHEVVRGVVSLYSAAGDAHRFEIEFEPGEGRLVFDPDQMNRLVQNLVKNAIEALPGGGVVRLATRTDVARGRFVFTVEDEGPGVPPEVAGNLFDPYMTTKPGGTGLGLAIVHRIASEHGGEVRLANPGEKGARFEVDLPGLAL